MSRLSDIFELPEGSIPNGAIAVCQYLNPEGEMKFAHVYDTQEMPLSTTLGLLELAKQHIFRRSLEEEED